MYSTQAARLAVLLCLLGAVAPLAAQDRIPWITDLEQARQLAERQNRLVLLHFWSETCTPCRMLETGVFNRPEFIRALTTGYIPVKINADEQPRLVTFYNIDSVPTDVIVTPEGREIQRFTSKQDSNAYIAMLDGIRARAGVGAYVQASNQGATPAQPVAQPYNGVQSGQSETQPAYGGSRPGYGETQPAYQGAQHTPGLGGQTPGHSGAQSQFANPLHDSVPARPSNVSPRYANPYAAEQPASPTRDSRWGSQEQSRFGAAGSSAPAGNPNQAGSEYEAATQNQTYDRQPQENQYARSAALQNGYGPASNSSQLQTNRYAHNSPQNPPLQGPHRGAPSYREAASNQQPQAASAAEPTFGLEGYCPVTLIDNRFWQAGDKRWGAVHEGHTYLFAGEQQQKKFLQAPHLYAPLVAGHDPVLFAETGQLVKGKREFGLYVEDPGPIALFADEGSLQRFEQNAGYYYDALRQASAKRSQQR